MIPRIFVTEGFFFNNSFSFQLHAPIFSLAGYLRLLAQAAGFESPRVEYERWIAFLNTVMQNFRVVDLYKSTIELY